MESLCCHLESLLIFLLDQVIYGNQVNSLTIQSNIVPLERVTHLHVTPSHTRRNSLKTKDVASLSELWKQDCSQSHWILAALFWIHSGINKHKIQVSVPSTKF